MTPRHIEIVAEKIFNSCLQLLNERLENNSSKKQICLQQLNDYYNIKPKDQVYLKNLQFLFETWSKTIPKIETEETQKKNKEVIYFYKPFGKSS